MTDQQEGALSVFRVLDLADSKGAYCTKLLADLGADVIKIEPPQGDQGRKMPPFLHDEPHPEKSLYFLYRNANKRGITLNLESRSSGFPSMRPCKVLPCMEEQLRIAPLRIAMLYSTWYKGMNAIDISLLRKRRKDGCKHRRESGGLNG